MQDILQVLFINKAVKNSIQMLDQEGILQTKTNKNYMEKVLVTFL